MYKRQGPGFINLFLGAHWFTSVLQAAATEPEYGRTDGGCLLYTSSNTIHSFAQGEIARKDYKGISGGFGSYAQHDAAKHMLRLRLPGGRVTPERLHFMAQAVQQYHVPVSYTHLDVYKRQVRGFPHAGAQRFAGAAHCRAEMCIRDRSLMISLCSLETPLMEWQV